jgi:hypothetical protein
MESIPLRQHTSQMYVSQGSVTLAAAIAPGSNVPHFVRHALADPNRILPEIQGVWSVLNCAEEETKTPKWRFRCSHRNRSRMR